MSEGASQVEAAVDHWMQLLRGPYRSSTIEHLQTALRSWPLTIKGVPQMTVLRPHFVTPRQQAGANGAAETVYRALQLVAARLRADVGFRRAHGFPAYLDKVIELERQAPAPSVIARIDGLYDEQGVLRFIELNTVPGGYSLVFEGARALARAPIAKEFAKRFPFVAQDFRDAPAEALIEEALRRGQRLPLTIATRREVAGVDGALMIPYLASRGFGVVYTDLETLDVRADGVFSADGQSIDIVNLMSDELLQDPEPLRPLRDALARGLVRTMYGVSQRFLCSNKLAFDILSDPSYAAMFDAETTRALQAHVPWTRRMRECKTTYRGQTIDLVPFVASHREDLVLKPAGSTGGEGVVVGHLCDDAKWAATLKQVTKRPHVVQERVAFRDEVFPMLVDGDIVEEQRNPDYDVYLWNGSYAEGADVRVGRGIHNVSAGASGAALFVLPDAS